MVEEIRPRKCFYCKWQLEHRDPRSKRYATRDHYIPKCLGGRFIVIACHQCNNEKGNTMPGEFMHYLEIVKDHRGLHERRRIWNEFLRGYIIAYTIS